MSYVRLNRRATLGLLAAVALAPVHAAGQPGVAAPVVKVPKPAPMDLCPVCGMVVSKYPAWVATVLWKNGQTHHFDGAKDMFKFLHNLAKYAPRQKAEDMVTIAVTEYYNLDKVDFYYTVSAPLTYPSPESVRTVFVAPCAASVAPPATRRSGSASAVSITCWTSACDSARP